MSTPSFLIAMALVLTGVPAAEGAEPVATPQGGIESLPMEERIALSVRWDLGYYLFQMQEYSAAVVEFEKIRKVLPGEATLLALIGSCYSLSGRWKEGEENLLKALAQDPADADVNGLLGQFYLSKGKGLKGAFYLENALKAAPELAELRLNLADVYLDAGQHSRARTHLETMLKERGGAEFGDVRLDHAYARCLVQAGRFLEALPFALRAHKDAPANPAFSRTLGLCLMGANRFGEAAQMLHAGRSVAGDAAGDAELHLQLGEALFQDRRWEAAEEAWLAGITRHSRSYPLYSRLVDYYLGINRPRQAARVVDFARGENPGHPGNLLLEVRLHRKLGDYAQSRKALVRLKRQACGSLAQEALWEEAQLEYETGRFTACGKILDRLLAKGKSEASPRLGEASLLKAKVYGRSAGRSPKPETGAKGSPTRPNPESLRAGRM